MATIWAFTGGMIFGAVFFALPEPLFWMMCGAALALAYSSAKGHVLRWIDAED